MFKVYIDGSAGTTGLRIYDRLNSRKDLDLIVLDDYNRKDVNYRREAINNSDLTFLCLPDNAAIEAVELIDNQDTVIIDTSTAHRVNDNWAYGFSEIEDNKIKIFNSKRIANPGCHASGFIALIAPLVINGIISNDSLLSATSLTGYSGGGKKMISQYVEDHSEELIAPRHYGLNQGHKHLPEMMKICNLNNAPCFNPVVSSFYSGMLVSIPIFTSQINGDKKTIIECYQDYYKEGLVSYSETIDNNGFISSSFMKDKDNMLVSVYGNDERIILYSVYDNLGKGASGAAIQNMNIVLGVDETLGLNI